MELDKAQIVNEDNEIVDYYAIKKINESKIEKNIIKIIREKKINNKLRFISGSGFFCRIPSKGLNALFTNNHVLDQTFLDNEKKLIYYIDKDGKDEEEKEINLEIRRYKYTNKEMDFTVIEILDEDGINSFLDIDNLFFQKII